VRKISTMSRRPGPHQGSQHADPSSHDPPITDSMEPQGRYLQKVGGIAETTEEGGLELITTLSQKCQNEPRTPVDGQTRAVCSIIPDRAFEG
jgi:hypothetical protein